jgi:flagellar M-ring protein FliF
VIAGATPTPGSSAQAAPPAPGSPAQAAPPGQATAASTGPSSSSQRSTRNFEVDRTLAYIKDPVGTLKRLSVGVVLDNWQKTDGDGKVTTAPMSDDDIKRFTQLVRESIGLKDDRGDKIDVMNQAFKNNAPIGPVDGPPLWQNPMVGQIAKQLVGAGLVLLVAFLILRPLMKSLTKGGKSATASLTGDDVSPDRVSLSGKGAANAIKLSPSFEQQIAAARTLVGQDPKRAAQVVKDWVAADG